MTLSVVLFKRPGENIMPLTYTTNGGKMVIHTAPLYITFGCTLLCFLGHFYDVFLSIMIVTENVEIVCPFVLGVTNFPLYRYSNSL